MTPAEAAGILGVTLDATFDDARKAYRRLARQWHPDRCRAADAHERMAEIAEAWETFSAYAPTDVEPEPAAPPVDPTPQPWVEPFDDEQADDPHRQAVLFVIGLRQLGCFDRATERRLREQLLQTLDVDGVLAVLRWAVDEAQMTTAPGARLHIGAGVVEDVGRAHSRGRRAA